MMVFAGGRLRTGDTTSSAELGGSQMSHFPYSGFTLTEFSLSGKQLLSFHPEIGHCE